MSLFVEEYLRTMRATISDHERQMRKASDWDDFMRRNGVLAGMEKALTVMTDMIEAAKKRSGEEDDGDEE